MQWQREEEGRPFVFNLKEFELYIGNILFNISPFFPIQQNDGSSGK